MSRAFSSKKTSSLPPPPTPNTIATSYSNRRQSPRSPLQDLNRISSSSNSSDASSCVSSEAPRGCLRFLASSSFKTPVHHRPKNISKISNSAPHELALKHSKSKSSKENFPKGNVGLQTKTLIPNKAKKNPPCIYQWQSGMKSGLMAGKKSNPSSALNEHGRILPALPSTPKELKQKQGALGGRNDNVSEPANLKSCHGDRNMTPLSKKFAGSDLDVTVYRDVEDNPNKSISRTPPIHNSVSPEVQCGPSLVSTTTTPACYAAGYIVSGVTDKRKCRPRGILTVEENYLSSAKMADNSVDEDEKKTKDIIKKDSPSLLPLPSEALVQWLSSPSSMGEKILNSKSEIGVNESQALAESTTIGSCTSPSSSSKTFWNVSDSSDLSSAAYGIRRKPKSSISPGRLSEFQVPFDSIMLPSYPSILFSPNSTPSWRAGSSENLIDENSPFSMNSIGSGNVIQTPQSDSSSDLHVGLSLAHADNQKEDNSNPDVNSLSEVLLLENFLFNSSAPLEDSVNSSFQFDCLTMPYESIDLSKLPKFLDDQDPWLSGSTIDNGSQYQMRISWREGLMSQVNELDEFDCCRCLSDEEDLVDDSGSNRLSGTQVNVEVDGAKKLNYDAVLTETEDNELEIDGFGKEMFPDLVSCSGAESISTDEGGLVTSRDDSDWTLCYLNKLFEV